MGRGAERRPAVMLRSPLPGRRTSGVLARVGLGRGGVSLPRTRQNRKCRLHTQAQVSVCVPTREPGLSCVGTKRRQESETKIQKEIALGWALNIDAPQKGREEKAGEGARPGPGDCITAAPAPENGPRSAATIMALAPDRASRAPSQSARATATEAPDCVSQTFPLARSPRARTYPPPTPPSFCMRVCARVCARLCARARRCVSV